MRGVLHNRQVLSAKTQLTPWTGDMTERVCFCFSPPQRKTYEVCKVLIYALNFPYSVQAHALKIQCLSLNVNAVPTLCSNCLCMSPFWGEVVRA